MTAFCASNPADGFAVRLLSDTDCQAFGLVERGYAALSAPGGAVSVALTGLMVIAVALFGYRLLLGRGLVLSEAVGLAIRLGVVLLIASSWETWQAVAYDSFARAPTRIADDMLVGINAPDPIAGLQAALDALDTASAGFRVRAGISSPLVGGPATAALALNLTAFLLTLGTVGILVATRIVLAILLGIAPVMGGFLLFDATRGMAQGWLGAMAAAALAPLFVLTLAAVEFAILDPLIARVLAEQAGGQFDVQSTMPIGLVAIIFAIALLIALRAGARIARGIRLHRAGSAARAGEVIVTERTETRPAMVEVPARSRAAAQLARTLESTVRRDTPGGPGRSRSVAAALGGRPAGEARRAAPVTGPAATEFMIARTPRMARGARRTRAASRRDG